jgi:hypothetical protein
LDIFTWVVLFKTTAYYPTKTTALYFFLQGVNLSRYQGVILKWQTGVTLIWRTGVNLSGFSMYNLTDLWSYIKVTHFDDVSVPIKSGTGQSHDRFYHITVTTPAKSFFVVVRDNERKKTEKYNTPESDTRVMLTNKIADLLK